MDARSPWNRVSAARAASFLAAALLAASAALAQQDRLHVYNWNNYITEDTVLRFQKACRCHLVQDYYADNEEMLAKLAAGAAGYDILVPTADAVATLIRQGALRPIEHRLLPNLANLKPDFMDGWFDRGNRYSAPYAYSVTLLGYNEQKMRELAIPTDTWAVIFEPKYLERMHGKVTVLDSQRELTAAALIYLGYPAFDTDPVHWRQARDLILRAKPYWAAFNAASYIKELSIGNIWLAHGYSNDMHTARQDARKAGRKFSIGYSTPREGAVFALDNLVIHKSSRRPDLAHKFINFLLEGESSAALSNAIGAGSPNAAAMPLMRPDIAGNAAVFPDREQMAKLQQLRELTRAERRLLNRMWIEIKVR
jgi:spermidine/putrescine transport system substrate-binding protein